jgi:Diacylglycerol kinase catalytic domain
MRYKNVCLIINPRDGQNMAKINDVLAVFSAAGWKTDMLLKTYCGQTMDLATQAAKKDYDLMVSYGGDGTLNQVINGVKNAKGKRVVGLLPGGTANEWAGEVQIPGDPVKAALALVKSEVREVDLGHVSVQRLIFTGAMEDAQKQAKGKAKIKSKDYLGKAERKVLEQQDSKDLVVDYRLDALPRAIQMAIPRTYDDALFEDKRHKGTAMAHAEDGDVAVSRDKGGQQAEEGKGGGEGERLSRSDQESAHIPGDVAALLDGARDVSVVGGIANVNKKKLGIIAGNTTKQSTGEKLPVAVRSDQKTVMINKAGEHVSQAVVEKLPEGETIVVKGKKSKRGVIQATHILV